HDLLPLFLNSEAASTSVVPPARNVLPSAHISMGCLFSGRICATPQLPAPLIRSEHGPAFMGVRAIVVVQPRPTRRVKVVAALLEVLSDIPLAATDDAVVRHLRRRSTGAAEQRHNNRTCTNDVSHSRNSPFFLSSPSRGQRRTAGEVRQNAPVRERG